MISFIVLHYKLLNETQKCVDSIINMCEKTKYNIVVVDNGSNNGTGEKLLNLYSESKYVKILINKDNLGFSAGNNVGCRYARDNFHPDFLYVINNDTIIEEKNVISKIEKYYSEQLFDMCGPCIYNVHTKTYSKMGVASQNYDEAMACAKHVKKCLSLLKINHYVYYIYNKLFTKKIKQTGIGINGAAIIFSKKYFDRFDQVFPEQNFIYCEESMLTYRTKKYNLKMVYCEEIKIIHNHSKSTISEKKLKKQLWLFQNENMLKGYNRLAELYKNDIDI